MIERQVATGIRAITDGEFRRDWFHLDFLQQLGGVTIEGMIAATSDSEETVHRRRPSITVTGKLTPRPSDPGGRLRVRGRSRPTAASKVAIPSPTMAHFRGGRAGIDIQSYPDLEVFFDDLAQVYRDEIAALYAPAAATSSSTTPTSRTCATPACARARSSAATIRTSSPHLRRADQRGARGRPDDLTVGIHLCRGNFRSTWFASGGYEPVAEVLFNELDVDAYFLEYDDERSGDFAPLRHVPPTRPSCSARHVEVPRARAGRRGGRRASTRRRSTCRSTSSASARSAGSRPPSTAT
jgi:5-methyltetrahydropteroyltriglutamate--homocysteine methyltransferase